MKEKIYNIQKSQKFCLLLLILTMCLLLCACGKSEEVIAVENQISDIGEVTEQSLGKIEKAQALYDSLGEKDRAKVENYADLQAAVDQYDGLIADRVANLIEAIGAVDENSLTLIVDAENAYSKLTDSQKSKVENYSTLQDARNTYSALSIKNIEKLIDSIKYTGGEPTQELQAKINAAQNEYDSLDASSKLQVKNYDALASAAEAVSSYFIQEAQNAITLAIDTDTEYEAAEALYKALTKSQKEKIVNYDTFSENYEAYKNRPPLELISYRLIDNYGYPDFYIKAKNVSDKIIKKFTLTVFAYDEDSVPVQVNYNEYAADLEYNNAIKVGETTSLSDYYWSFWGGGSSDDMDQIVAIIKEVDFFEGPKWENSQYDTLRAKYEQELLPEDAVILQRG